MCIRDRPETNCCPDRHWSALCWPTKAQNAQGRMPESQLIVHDLQASSHPGRYAHTPAYQVEVTHVSLSEVLAAMSRALDLTEGRMEGHTVRTCIIGTVSYTHL